MGISKEEILALLNNYENPGRIAFSRKYPFLKKPIIHLRCFIRKLQNIFDPGISYKKSGAYYKCIIARHQSVLRRKLGNSDPELQENKIINLKQAIRSLDGIIIEPNKVFSFWTIVGKPSYKKGYVDGMLLSNGKVIKGVGGGLCQLSNFLYWIFLHIPMETVERYHHSMDVFPDSGRVLPFGSGATVLYNFVDLKVRNKLEYPIQIKIWLSDNYLKGQILCQNHIKEKFHIVEKNHFLIKRNKSYFRYNEIYREVKIDGKIVDVEKITRNFSPVLYKITDEYIEKNNIKVLDFM
ncbi:MAG: VanW family protein [Treponema sp.]|jgi:vancomycin resistance protein VanW|nr:VanW family protein [Treponema sp.]